MHPIERRVVTLARHPAHALFALFLCMLEVCGNPRVSAAQIGNDLDVEHFVAEQRALVTRVMHETHMVGCDVAASVGGMIIWEEGFGDADAENHVPVTPRTCFRVASISKTLTSAAVGQLVERGMLDMDAPIQKYVPQFPRKTWSISLRQLAGHLAGIRHYDNGEMYSMKHYPDVLSGLVIFQDDSLLFEPGTRYSYSSYGWNLISAALETASGRPFLELMQHDVFEAAGMDNTLPEFQEPLIPNRARFYDVADDGTVTNAPYVDNSYKWASGGFLSTAGDLVRFGNAMLHGDLVDLDTFRWLTTSQATTDGEETNYGIGWRTNMAALAKHGLRFHDERIAERTEARLQGVLVVGHTGGAIGGKGILLVAPDQDVVVAALTNCNLAPRFALVVLADLVAELSSVPVNSSSSAHD